MGWRSSTKKLNVTIMKFENFNFMYYKIPGLNAYQEQQPFLSMSQIALLLSITTISFLFSFVKKLSPIILSPP